MPPGTSPVAASLNLCQMSPSLHFHTNVNLIYFSAIFRMLLPGGQTEKRPSVCKKLH